MARMVPLMSFYQESFIQGMVRSSQAFDFLAFRFSKNADGAHDGSHIVEGSDIRSPLLWPHPRSGVGHKRLRFYQMFPRRT